MQGISHILVLVVLNTCVQDQLFLWVLQWGVNDLEPPLSSVSLGDSSTSPSTAGTRLEVPEQCKDEAVMRMTCHLPAPWVLEVWGIPPGGIWISRDLQTFVNLRADSFCQESQ